MKENPIPEEILENAVMLCNEPFWHYVDALHVVGKLSTTSHAIVGVELFEQVGDSPKWIATSNYNHDKSVLWDEFVELCNTSAKEFIETNKEHEGALFNFSYE